MAISNYSDLQSQIASYLARDDLTSQIPTFIQLTEAKLQRKFVGVTSLSSINTTNWMLTNNPDVYLYGALLEAQPYLMADERIATWAEIYTTVLAQVRYPSTSANFTNYSGLQAAIEDWINRSDLTDAISNFIRLAEVKFSIKFKSFTPLSVGSPTNSILTNYPDVYLYGTLVEYATYVNDIANLPIFEKELANRLSIIRVTDSSSALANYTGLQSAILDWAERPDLSGNVTDFIQLAETKLQRLFKSVTALSVGSPTNWLLTNYPDTYLYGSLVELAAYAKDEAKAAVWKAALDATLSTIRYPDTDSNFTNYTGLQAAIADWMQRPDLATEIPNFIKLAETKFYIKFKNFTGLSSGSPTNSILTNYPDLYLYASLVEVATYLKDTVNLPALQNELSTRLSLVRVTDTTTAFDTYAGLQAAIIDWVERPDLASNAPDFIKLAEVKLQRLFKNVTALSNSNTSNWLLTSYPDVYMYASLVEFAGYINDQQRATNWQTLLDLTLKNVRVPDTTSSFTNYTGLTAMVADWLNRPDLVNIIPTFITMAQFKMTRDLRTERMLKVATTSPTDNKVAFPSDFLELREIHFQGNPPILLEFQTPDLFFRNGQTTLSGRSHYFTMLGTEFQFAPSQDTSYTIQILYYAQPTFISSTTASNLYLAYYPDALLYATLAEAEPYLMNDPRVQTWSALYDRAIANIKKSDLGQTYAYTTLSVTPR